ncbi:hypothetical protein JWG44_17890 [Leptospira sp. 201903071]|nr:hypothetical protein [Leptospira ainazelensis]MBM9502133.1 hypothetical protein [Leptospira ainazelensis]
MREKFKLGTVIAKRELDLSQGKTKQKVIVKIGKPKPSEDKKMDWYCPFQIQGLGLDEIKVSFGIDSIQALQLAMEMIGSILRLHYQRINPGKLTWLNEENLGFPLPETPEMFLKKEIAWKKLLQRKKRNLKK